MADLRYEAPETLQAAVALLAGATGPARRTCWRHRCYRSDGNRPDRALAPRRHQENPGNPADRGGEWRISHRRGGAGHGDHGTCRPQQGLARRGRGREADRIDPGARPRLDWRQPVQRLAGCRQRAGADRGRARSARVVGPNGTREVPVEQIPTGPGKTSLAKGEIIVSFFLPARPPHSGDAYQRFTPRTEMDIAVVGVGVSLTLDNGGTCTAARVALGAVAPTALLVKAAADTLIGTKVDDAALAKACGCGERGLQADRRQARHHRISDQGRRRVGPAYSPAGARTGEEELRMSAQGHDSLLRSSPRRRGPRTACCGVGTSDRGFPLARE